MKHINRTKLRKIKVHKETYLWKRGHYHLPKFETSECVEKVIIYLEGFKQSPLQLLFKQDDNKLLMNTTKNEYWCVGYPDSGVIWSFNQSEVNNKKSIQINLNRPAVISPLIEYHLANTWRPKEDKRPCLIDDALKLLEVIKFPNGIK